MIATADIGQTAADLLRESWTGRRIVELAGPRDYSPNDVAAVLAATVGKPVKAAVIPREQWTGTYQHFGFSQPAAAAMGEMCDSFNNGWIHFNPGDPGIEHRTGKTTLETVLKNLAQSGPG